MNNIERYKQLEKQIKWIKTELNKGEYKGAGLLVDISIGADEPFESFSFGILSGIEQELLELILKGLEENKKYVLKSIEREQKELTEFLEKL